MIQSQLPLSRELGPGLEFVLHKAQEPHLYVVKRQQRSNSATATASAFYYILDGAIYQAPTLHAALSSRIVGACLCG